MQTCAALYRIGALDSLQVERIRQYLAVLSNYNDEFVVPTIAERRSNSAAIARDESSRWLFETIGDLFSQANQQFHFDLTTVDEPLQLIRYTEGGRVDWHFDCGDEPDGVERRKLSLTVQLSAADSYEGGNIEFAAQTNNQFSRRVGTVIVFPSFCAHRVTPVTKGVRDSLVAFMLGPPLR
jgi:PKHD-type hydroxylase